MLLMGADELLLFRFQKEVTPRSRMCEERRQREVTDGEAEAAGGSGADDDHVGVITV